MSTETAYGGLIYRGQVVDAANPGPANSIAFTKDSSNSFTATVYNGVQKTVSSAWALIDSSTGFSSSTDFPVFSFSVSGVETVLAPTTASLAVGQGALVFYQNIPSSDLFRFSNRRSVSLTPSVGGSAGLNADTIVFGNNASMSTGVNFNVYSVGFQFTDGSATEIQFINDTAGPNIVGTNVYQATDVTNKFAELADIYIDDAVTYFNNRIYDDSNLLTNIETTFNLVAQKVPNMLDVSDSVVIVGTLAVSNTGQPISSVSITASAQAQFLDVLFDQDVTVGGITYTKLKDFSKSTATDNDSMNTLRNNFITSFVEHASFYFSNIANLGSSVSYPSTEVNTFLQEYLKPILKRARFFAMAAMTGTNVVPISGNTNTMYLLDSNQPWSSFAALTLNGVPKFEARMEQIHGFVNYGRYMDHVKMYERTLTAGGIDWSHMAAGQQPYAYTQKFLTQLQAVTSAQDAAILKLLQVWNISRIHNAAYDNDGNIGQTDTADGVTVRQQGNANSWDGSTVGDLQLEIYQTYGYGASYTWLSNASGFLGEVSEPNGSDVSYIDAQLLDRVLVHLRLNEFAEDIRPAGIVDSYEQTGWTTFVDAFLRYYFWSATSAASSGDFTAEQNFIGRKATFLRAFDASLSANAAFNLNQHILEAAKSVLTAESSGVFYEAQALVNALSQVRSLNSATYWNDVVVRRLNHLPYHVVWDQTENMISKSLGSSIAQDASVLIASLNNLVEFYPRTTTEDANSNTLVPSVYDWYRVVGYLAAVPQELPAGTDMYSSEIGFSRTTRATYPFLALQTMGPQAFFNELTRRIYYFHRCDPSFVASAALNSTHDQTLSTAFSSSVVLGEYDPNTDAYTTGYRSWSNVNNYYQLLKKENDLRLAISNQNSEYDLEDLVRIFDSANTNLDAKITAIGETNTAVNQDINSLNTAISSYHDPYLGATTISELQVRYVQVASENRAQDALKTTYGIFGTLVGQVKTSSSQVSAAQVTYQQKLNTYNTAFDEYISRYNEWNALLDNASALIESSTSYVDLLSARITLTAEVSQLRAKFNADVIQIRSVVQAVQQTFLNLKSQGVRAIPSSSTGSSEKIGNVTYQRRAQTTFDIVDLLDFVPK